MSDGQHEHETVASGGVHAVSDDSVDSNEEAVDPRVQVELERLNSATDLINKLEIELDEARSSFRLLLSESSHRVNQLSKKLGSCVEKARPYYEARMQAKQLQAQTQKAALRYERASSAHAAAKEMVYLAEEGLKKEGRCFDPAWQEMLNHATMRVNEAESERIHSEHEHQQTSAMYNEAEKKVQNLHQQLKRSIVKSSLSTRRSLLHLNNLAHQHQLQLLPYFEMKARFNQLLEEQRNKVHHLEENVLKVKMSYADALHNLEEISDEIHQKRKLVDSRMSNEERSEGVGAESPDHTWNNCVKLAYQLSRRSISSEDLFPDSLNPEDTYLSLPSKLSSRQGLFSTGSLENDSQGRPRQTKASCHLPVILQNYEFQDSVGEKMNKYDNDWTTYRDVSIANSLDGSTEKVSKNESKLMQDGNLDTVIRQQLTGDGSELESGALPQTFDRSPEGAEVPDQKFSVQDLNILRVQREDLSDSESLASNDTTDTLDDNQIECLMLDQVLPHDMQDMALTDSEKVPSGS